MRKPEQFYRVGQVLKSNGTDGEVLISLRGIDAEDISEKEPVFIYFDGLPVPYFIESFHQRGNSRILAHLTDVENLGDAEELSGKELWMYDESGESESYDEDFAGWKLVNDGEPAGVVAGFVDIPANPCLELENGTLIPLNEDFIESVDKKTKTLRMHLPSGLL